ncbi:hypothetical protein [Lentibacillus sp. Marseille-P4043]|nr:hypothetical protein [Lentibacillus sp. Marseille-P4043]
MKKLIATFALGILLVTGFLVSSSDSQHDSTMEREPSILSISNTGSFF